MKRSFIYIICVLSLLFSCSHKDGSGNVNRMVSAVPSDAVAFAAYDRAEDMAALLLSSGDALGRLRLDGLGKRPSALSFCYANTLIPILAVDAGKNASDTLEPLRSVICQADSLGLRSALVRDQSGARSILVVTRSITLLDESVRHITEGKSICDAAAFEDVLPLMAGNDVIVLRNGASRRWLRHTCGAYSIADVASMLKTLTDWTVLSDCGGGRFRLDFSDETSKTCYASVLKGMEEAPLKVREAVGDSCAFCMSIAAGPGVFRENYEGWLDAGMALVKYRATLAKLKKLHGKNPLEWEKEQSVCEVAVVNDRENDLLLIRHGRGSGKDERAMQNMYPGFIKALYGKAFGSCDEYCARRGEWTAFGSEDSVNSWIDKGPGKKDELKPFSFYVQDGISLVYGEKKQKQILWNLNQ